MVLESLLIYMSKCLLKQNASPRQTEHARSLDSQLGHARKNSSRSWSTVGLIPSCWRLEPPSHPIPSHPFHPTQAWASCTALSATMQHTECTTSELGNTYIQQASDASRLDSPVPGWGPRAVTTHVSSPAACRHDGQANLFSLSDRQRQTIRPFNVFLGLFLVRRKRGGGGPNERGSAPASTVQGSRRKS